MLGRNSWPPLLVLAGLFSSWGGTAEAAVVHFHYVRTESCPNTAMKPSEGTGESTRWLGMVREPSQDWLRPTHVVTFRHPYTAQKVSVPLAFPEGTPMILHGRDRITFNYGSYAVRVRFLPDGSVDVAYDSGFLRAP